MTTWSLQHAKSRFSELINDAIAHGPQIVTRNGVDAVVVLSIDDWRRIQAAGPPSLKDVLLGPAPRNILIPPRGRGKWRKPPIFD